MPLPSFLRAKTTLAVLAVGIAGILLILYAWRLPPFATSVQTTDNAYVRGAVTLISPQLSGYVDEVPVQDFMEVKEGQLLVKLDDRTYRQLLAQARADLATREAELAGSDQDRRGKEAGVALGEARLEGARSALAKAQADMRRTASLRDKGIASQSQADQDRAALRQAEAEVAEAEASLALAREDLAATLVNRRSLEAAVEKARAAVELAEIDLDNTRITAPRDGRLGEVGARIGQYVGAGTQLMALVPDRIWVVANYKETQIAGMRPGQPAVVAVDALGRAPLAGHVERFSPAAGSEFSVLHPDNATGNFTKVAQRIPVRIAIDPGQPLAERLVPGMSVVVSIDASSDPRAVAEEVADGPG
jgi:multidrug resistance efflux pump